MIGLLFLTLLLIFLYKKTQKETLLACGCGIRGCPWCLLQRSNCSTRNMSYDIRGETFFPQKRNFPFDNSVIGPNNSRCYPKRYTNEM
jgi:hypothetical protein